MKKTYLVGAAASAMALALSGCKTTDAMGNALSEMGFQTPSETSGSSTGKKVAGGLGGCAIGGAAGYFGTKALSGLLKDDGFTGAQINQAAAIVAGLGCIVGGKVAVDIIKNMDEKSKQAQEDAWARAQAQTETQAEATPQAWKTETHEGTVEILDPVTSDDGQQCATRRNFIKTSDGEAEQFIPVCKNNSGIYEPQAT